MTPPLPERAQRLRLLHDDRPLVLPNAWDASSARAFTATGSAAVATTSSGVAATLGHPDGEGMPVDEALAAIGRIARAVDVPVSADVEAGYGLPAQELVARLIDAGAAGCNLEDTDHTTHALVPVNEQAERLGSVVDAARSAAVPLVINARIDVFVRAAGDSNDERIVLAVERAAAYFAAGVDCVYPIGAPDPATYAAIVTHLNGRHVNALHRPDFDFGDLKATGIARITFGGGLHRLIRARTDELAATLASGTDPYDV